MGMLELHPLYGKKVTVLGDSISTVYEHNTPFWMIKSIDVGHPICSYVSWFDVYKDLDVHNGTTEKRIGGVLLTESMVGEKHTFIPLAEDVGKTIGEVRNYNDKNTYVWHQRLCDYTGATLLANASWSGSTIVNARESRGLPFQNMHAWSDYTIGRCHLRDDDGTYIDPDVIIIERGTNDFTFFNYPSYPHMSIDSVNVDSGITWEDDLVNGVVNFNAAYCLTIKKLRALYPNAQIFCCTINVIRRANASDFPTRNLSFSLPAINNAIRTVANMMGCDVINFDRSGMTVENCYPTYIDDSPDMATHPNNMGHELMARRAMADIRYVM